MVNYYAYRAQEPEKKINPYKILSAIFLIIFIGAMVYIFNSRLNRKNVVSKNVIKVKYEQNISQAIKDDIEKYFKEKKDFGEVNFTDDQADIIITRNQEQSRRNKTILSSEPKKDAKFLFNGDKITREFSEVFMFWDDEKFNGLASTLAKNHKLKDIEITAVGDIMLSRHVGSKIREAKNPNLPFEKTKDLISTSDLTFANLESPFFDKGKPVTAGMTFKAEPETIEGLTFAGIDIVSLANNHFGNQGKAGMEYTFDHLKNAGIDYVGAGNNNAQAHTPVFKELKEIKFAFLAYDGVDSTPNSYYATVKTPGMAKAEVEEVEKDIKSAKEKADVVIVSLHAGTEYTPYPNGFQKEYAQAAGNAGADLIIGHHPHVIQGISQFSNTLVFYSLGNFVFDQMFSTETAQGLVVKYIFSGKYLKSAQMIPVHIYDYNQPRKASPEESDSIFTRIKEASDLK